MINLIATLAKAQAGIILTSNGGWRSVAYVL